MGHFANGVSYMGRLVAGTLREWLRLWALARETAALEDRRDELLLHLGARYQTFLLETNSSPPTAVAETVHDLRAVMQRLNSLDEQKRRVREETETYVHPEPVFAPPGFPPLPPELAQPMPSRPVPSMSVPAPPAREAERASQSSPPEPDDLPEEWWVRRIRERSRQAEPEMPEERCECGAVFPEGSRFCPACGKPHAGEETAAPPPPELAPTRKCAYCGADLPFRAEFCPKCGGHVDSEVHEV